MNSQKKYDVFISSKSEDYPMAEKVYDYLLANGYSVFLACRELQRIGDAQYADAIDEAIDNAQHMIVVASSLENIHSKWVKYEWRTFSNDLKSNYKLGNLLTILSTSIPLSSLPATLRHQQSFSIDNFTPNILGYLHNTTIEEQVHKKGETHYLESNFHNIYPLTTPSQSDHYIHLQNELTEAATITYETQHMYKSNSIKTATIVHFKGNPQTIIALDKLSHEGSTYYLTRIKDRAFYRCTSLSIFIMVLDSITIIGKEAFKYCTSLNYIELSKSLQGIEEDTFFGCSSLPSITIPSSVKSIGVFAFFGCLALTTINFTGTKQQWRSIKKKNRWNANVPAKVVHCTDGDVEI